MTPEIEAAITQAAQDAGEDPAFALAVADRESNGDPTARASKSIFGLFQMSGPLRQKYGIGNSTDPYTQASGWMHFIQDTRNGMAQRMGRAPTDPELYMGHYFGEGRGARVVGQLPPTTDVRDVFSPQELALNPGLARAGTTGAVVSSITGDINRRMAKFGENQTAPEAPDFASFGQTADGQGSPNFWETNQNRTANSQPQGIDFAQFGKTSDEISGANNAPPPAQSPGENQTFAASDAGNSIEGPLSVTAAMAPNGFDYSDWRRSSNVEDETGLTGWDKIKSLLPSSRPAAAPSTAPGAEVDLSDLGLSLPAVPPLPPPLPNVPVTGL